MLSLFKRKKTEEVKIAFETELRNKYNEDFVVDHIEKVKDGTYRKGYTCEASPVNDPNKIFQANLSKQLDQLTDLYTLLLYEDNIRKEIQRIAANYFSSTFWLDSEVFSFPSSEINKRTFTSFREFMDAARDDLAISMKIIFAARMIMHHASEAEQINKFLEKIVQIGILKGDLFIHYGKTDNLKKLVKEYKQYAEEQVEFFRSEQIHNENVYELVIEPDLPNDSLEPYTFIGIDFEKNDIPSQMEIAKYLEEF